MNFTKSFLLASVMMLGTSSFASVIQSYDCKLAQPVERNLFSGNYSGMMGYGEESSPGSKIRFDAFMNPASDESGSLFTFSVTDFNTRAPKSETREFFVNVNTDVVAKIENFAASDGQQYTMVCSVSVKSRKN